MIRIPMTVILLLAAAAVGSAQPPSGSPPPRSSESRNPAAERPENRGPASQDNFGRRRWRGEFGFSFLRVHDPSTIVRADGRYWLFYTGRGVPSLYSDDLINWERGEPVFEFLPDWVSQAVPENRGFFWAPDLIQVGDRYLVFYSVSVFGKRTSAIAVASSPTLDPADPSFQWTDHGIVVQTDEASDHNAIDPSVCLTSAGELWMSYGSFWSGIKLVQLDPETGLRLSADSPLYSLAHQAQIEAPCLFERDGLYYLLVNWGWCCRGVNSTYNIRVGRSPTITGPYLDRDGKDLRNGGGTLVLATEGVQIGPGHPGVLQTDDQWKLSYHYYDAGARGLSRLGLRTLRWTADGWPEVAPEPEAK